MQIFGVVSRKNDDPVLAHSPGDRIGEDLGAVQSRHFQIDQEKIEIIGDGDEALDRIIAGLDSQAGIALLYRVFEQLEKG
jgi:hypothetical protein